MRWTLSALAIFASSLAWSNPSGHHVVHGEAQVTHSSRGCHIHASDQTVIHWQDFSIGAGEVTRFIQPSNQSVVLNQVVGNRLSEIYGTLEANGKLFLLNQNGILFGENALVNVGELIASTLNLSLEDFLKGDTLHFHGTSKAAIINHGTLSSTSGNVTLFSRHILNTGSIQTPNGKTELVAAAEIFLKPHSAKRILIQPSQDEKAEVGIDQQGKIAALETYLQADGYLYDLAIKHDGEIDALTFKNEGGRVFLRADQGKATLSGNIHAPRGEITVTGQQVLVLDDAHLSVSDMHHAGNIHLGKGSDLTFVAKEAHLEANTLKSGLGGNILALSDGTSLFLGKADVRGGLHGGDGGFIEVSGAKSTLFHGTTDRFAPFGKSGTLLLDPEANFVISTNFEYNYTSLPPNFFPTADTVNLSIDTLLSELQQGPVTIQTYYEGEGGLSGHIQLSSDVIRSYDSPHTLSLNSTGKEGILWNGKLLNTGSGNIELIAKHGPIVVTPESATTPALIQTAGNILLDAFSTIDLQGKCSQCAAIKTTQAGTISMQSQDGIALSSTDKAPALVHVEDGLLKINTYGPLNLYGQGNAAAELRSNGMGDITILNTDSIDLFAESGPALISFSHQFGNLHIDTVKQGIEIWAFQDTAAIEGGLGSVNLKHIEGDINLIAEYGNASISAIGPLTIRTNSSIHLDAIQSDATLGSNHLVQLFAGGTFLLTAEEGTASLLSLQGMMLQAQEDVLFNGTATGQAFVRSPNTNLFVGHDLDLFSHTAIDGGNGPLLISVGHDFSMSNPLTTLKPSITGAEVKVSVVHDLFMTHNATLSATNGSLDLSIGETGSLDQAASLVSKGGPLTINSLQGNLYFRNTSSARAQNHDLSITAGKSILIEGFSRLECHGNEGMTILVDALHPQSVGVGGLVLGHNASLSSGQAPIQIFTAKRSLNSIDGTLNGYRVASAPLYINTKEELWGIFYPQQDTSHLATSSNSFSVFHKELGLIQLTSPGVTQKDFTRMVINFTGPFTAELFRDLHPYNEYTAESESFTVTYPEGHTPEVEPFSIKRPTFRYQTITN